MGFRQQTGLHRPTALIGVGLIALATLTWFDARGMTMAANYGVGADAASYFVALVLLGRFLEARAKGKARLEGKDYVMQDGDVVEFRFNV